MANTHEMPNADNLVDVWLEKAGDSRRLIHEQCDRLEQALTEMISERKLNMSDELYKSKKDQILKIREMVANLG